MFIEVPVGDDQEWTAAFGLVPDDDGRPIVVELRVFPDNAKGGTPTAGGGLTARALRTLRLGEARQRAIEELVTSHDWWDYGVEIDLSSAEVDALDPKSGADLTDAVLASLRTSQRPTLDDRFYAGIALGYTDALQDAPTAPLVLLRRWLEEAGDHHSATTVRDWVAEARNRGLLARPKKRKAGGELTPKGWAALGDELSQRAEQRLTPSGKEVARRWPGTDEEVAEQLRVNVEEVRRARAEESD